MNRRTFLLAAAAAPIAALPRATFPEQPPAQSWNECCELAGIDPRDFRDEWRRTKQQFEATFPYTHWRRA
jgi:hypothetical protein